MPQIPAERMSHGLRVVVTATRSHGATPRGRQLSARIISFFEDEVAEFGGIRNTPEGLAAENTEVTE